LIDREAAREARRLGHTMLGEEHYLLAILAAAPDSAAAAVLEDCGLTATAIENWLAEKKWPRRPAPGSFVKVGPRAGRLRARAEGLAAGIGEPGPTPEHLLLAFVWDGLSVNLVDRAGVTREAVVTALASRGVDVPSVPLPPALAERERQQEVVIPRSESEAVVSYLGTLCEPMAMAWRHLDAYRTWIAADDSLGDLSELVRSARADRAG
jgi:ATP-dependent Clp protease ATP-binding subunit ClpA